MSDNLYEPGIIGVDSEITAPPSGSYTGVNTKGERKNTKGSAKETVVKPEIKRGDSAFKKFFSVFTGRRLQLALGIIIILAAAFLIISAVSYLINGGSDQSEVLGQTVESIVADPGMQVKNVGGPLGAVLSHKFLSMGLGVGVIPIYIYLVLIGLALLGIRKCQFWSMTFKTLLLATTLSMVLGLVTFNADMVLPAGGYHGHFINFWLLERASWIGAAAVSLALIGCVLAVYFYDLLKIWNAYRKKMAQIKELRRQRAEAKLAQWKETQAAMHASDLAGSEDKTEEPASRNTVGKVIDLDNIFEPAPEENDIFERNKPENDGVAEVPQEKPDEENDTISDDSSQTEPDDTAVQREQSADIEPDFNINETEEIEQSNRKAQEPYDPTAELSRFKMPRLDLLIDREVKTDNVDITEVEENKNQIIQALSKLKIEISKIEATVGPTVTMYEIVPQEGIKIATIKRLEEDIAMALAALSTRIIAPIPGKGAIGIEVPNRDPQSVPIRAILGSKKYQETDYALPIALGATITNDVYIADLTKMPHLLVAGATGKGKSVGMNVIINSLLYKKHPAELKFVLIDPKMVEFYPYRKLERHYLAKLPGEEDAIVTNMSKVVDTLKSLCIEMDNRYRLLMDAEVVQITQYNNLFIQRKLNPEKGHRFMPYIVVIVDEYADLVMTAGKEVETPVARIAQKARAVGIHMIIATQRPSANIITGVIRANFPARIAFQVSSRIDSKIILENNGASQLIGKGDMLISHDSKFQRVQCAFIDTPEIKDVCQFIGDQPGYPEPYLLPEPEMEAGGSSAGVAGNNFGDKDPLFEEVARMVVDSGVASTSGVQRRYSIGFNRAGKIMDQMEACGIVGPAKGGKPRDILVDMYRLEEILSQ